MSVNNIVLQKLCFSDVGLLSKGYCPWRVNLKLPHFSPIFASLPAICMIRHRIQKTKKLVRFRNSSTYWEVNQYKQPVFGFWHNYRTSDRE